MGTQTVGLGRGPRRALRVGRGARRAGCLAALCRLGRLPLLLRSGSRASTSMPAPVSPTASIDAFPHSWSNVHASERAISQSFLNELCDLLGVPRYRTTRRPTNSNGPMSVVHQGGKADHEVFRSTCNNGDAFAWSLEIHRIDNRRDRSLRYTRRGPPAARKNKIIRGDRAVDRRMLRAFLQAERYAHRLPNDDAAPIFLNHTVDVRPCHALTPTLPERPQLRRFPRFARARIPARRSRQTPDVRNPAPRLDPLPRSSIRPNDDPVTLAVARHLAALATSLEKAGNRPKLVASSSAAACSACSPRTSDCSKKTLQEVP